MELVRIYKRKSDGKEFINYEEDAKKYNGYKFFYEVGGPDNPEDIKVKLEDLKNYDLVDEYEED